MTEQKQEPGFEELLQELTQVVQRLEAGNLPLEESLALFARGTQLQNAAKEILQKATMQLEQLLTTASGDIAPKPLDPDDFL